jgi:hypothetical protein
MNLLDVFCEKNTETFRRHSLCGYKYDMRDISDFCRREKESRLTVNMLTVRFCLQTRRTYTPYVNYARTVSKNTA